MGHAESTKAAKSDATPVQPDGTGTFTPMQQFALARYAKLDAMRRDVLPTLDSSHWQARLIHKALYSAYRDCEAAGVAEEMKLLGSST